MVNRSHTRAVVLSSLVGAVCFSGPVAAQAPSGSRDTASHAPTTALAHRQTDGSGPATSPPDNPRAPVAHAIRLDGVIIVDGRLDEPEWRTVPAVDELTQVMPDEAQPVSQRTEFRVMYDDEALYVGVRAWDDGPITTRMGRRDMPLMDSDWIGIVVDSYHDHRTGFTFDVNPGGVRRDATKQTVAGGHEQDDNSWDGVWEGASTVDDEGWSVEYRIPFSQLRFRQGDELVWGIQFERVIGRNNEYAVSSFTPRAERGGIATYGHLEGLEGIGGGDRLELLPYMVARSEHVDPGFNPYRTDSERGFTGGFDFRYRLSSNFTVNGTINPDFGQVEVDPAVVNLGVYEVFFEEKRPFFIEGAEIFDFSRSTSGGRIFHSRRIGRAPQLSPPTLYADIPPETTILGAAKLSGKSPGGWSFGLLEAVTGEETAQFRLEAEGLDQTMAVEPLSNYMVGRARRDFRGGLSTFGAIGTAVYRRLTDPPLMAAMTEQAYTVGGDLNHEFGGRVWAVRAQATGSRVSGSTAAMTSLQRRSHHYFQRPDADHLAVDSTATSLTGYSAAIELAKQAGEHWLGNVAAAITAPQYEINDLGFGTRTDRKDVTGTLTYRDIVPGDFVRDWSVSLHGRREQNFANQPILAFTNLGGRFRHLNFWGVNASVSYFESTMDDRNTRGGPLMERPAGWSFRVGANTDARKAFTVNVNANISRSDYDIEENSAGITFGIKPSSRWNLTLGPEVYFSSGKAQYVGTVRNVDYAPTFDAYYLFAPLEQTQVSLETRFNFTFRPGLSIELFIQPLISAGEYDKVGYLTAPQGYEFTNYEGEAPDPDFNFRSLRGNAVLRWEWRPGSNIYLAWQQRRADVENVGDFDWGRDRDALWGAEADNIFVFKVSYWFSQ